MSLSHVEWAHLRGPGQVPDVGRVTRSGAGWPCTCLLFGIFQGQQEQSTGCNLLNHTIIEGVCSTPKGLSGEARICLAGSVRISTDVAHLNCMRFNV